MNFIRVITKYLHFSRRMGFGFLFLTLFFLLSFPTPSSFFTGVIIAALGEGIRVWSAGYIHKKSILTTAGPYAHTRNPLYFGSFLIGCGLSIISNTVYLFGFFLIAYAFIYTKTMKEEEAYLEKEFGNEFLGYKYSVPFFIPNLSSRGIPNNNGLQFSWHHALAINKNAEIEGVLGFVSYCVLTDLLLNADNANNIKGGVLGFIVLFLIARWTFYYFKAQKKTG